MARDRDPVAARSDDATDLYGVAEWEVRTVSDRLVYWFYHALRVFLKALVVLVAFGILLAQVLLGGLGAVTDPILGAFTLLSALPAFALAAYVWYADVTTQEPLSLLVATFLLGVLFAGFAGVLNSEVGPVVRNVASLGGLVPLFGSVAFFYVVVGPVEETVKLLAVRLFAYRSDRFDAVVDGAVYGAMAGLGFATIENAIYITRDVGPALSASTAIDEAGGITFARSLAGPGHVIYSAFAGYYLGLAKFNREHAGPIVLKGLLIAALIHATYNTLVGVVPAVVGFASGLDASLAAFGFILLFDGIFAVLLVSKIRDYERAYRAAAPTDDYEPELTEFES